VATNDFKTYNTVQSALKNQIITVIEPMYIEILNNDLVGSANTTSRDMLDHLFISYGSIAAVDIEQNFENNQLKHCSNKSKTVLNSQRPAGLRLERYKNCPLPTQKSSSQENSTVPATDGTKIQKGTALGTISRFIFLLLTASTDRCRERQLEPKDLPMQQSPKQAKMTWQNKPWELLQIWQQQQLLTEMW
jgi:hypothetical protein